MGAKAGPRKLVIALLTIALLAGQVPARLLPAISDGAPPEAAAVPTVFTLGVGDAPADVTVNEATDRAYVSNGAGTVSVVQLGATPAASTVIATITVGTDPRKAGVNTATNRIYVPNYGSDNVSVIDGTTNAVIATVPVVDGPIAAAVDPTDGKIYVANNAGTGNIISIINPDNTGFASLILPGDVMFLTDIAINATTHTLYVAANSANVLYARNLTTGATASVGLGSGANPFGIAVNETTDQVWVATSTGYSVVNGDTHTVDATGAISTNHERIAVNPDANRAYLADVSPAGVTAVDGASHLGPAAVSTTASKGVAVDRSTKYAVVTNLFGDSVQIILEDSNAFASRFFVNTVADGCCTNDGALTLREAISYARGSSAAGFADLRRKSGLGIGAGSQDNIHFSAAGGTFALSGASGLPSLQGGDSVIASSPGLVTIDGGGLTACTSAPCPNGLTVEGNGSTIWNVKIRKFAAHGIHVVGTSSNTTIRAVTLVENSVDGVRMESTGTNNVIESSFIGTDSAGTAGIGNGNYGIQIANGSGTIGGKGKGNVVSGNKSYGVAIGGSGGTYTIQENVVGLGPGGIGALGNAASGIRIQDSITATILDNIVGANGSHGLWVVGPIAPNVVTASGNRVGVDAAGGAAGNLGQGVLLQAASSNTISGNNIGYNTGNGIWLLDGNGNTFSGNVVHHNAEGIRIESTGAASPTAGNTIAAGSITANSGKGIGLYSGANGGVLPPTVTDVGLGGPTGLIVRGTAGAGAVVRIYVDPDDEGETFLGQVTADELGTWEKASGWTLTDLSAITTALKAGTLHVRATQTDTAGNTSEFSGTVAPSGIAGTAACVQGEFLVTLPGATVELYSGSALVATTTADAETAHYLFADVAPGDYTVRYVLGGVICGSALTVDGSGGASVTPDDLPLDYGNHVWTKALRLDVLGDPDRNVEIQEHIVKQGQSDWFKFTIEPESRVVVVVTGLPANYDLTLYKDIASAFSAIVSPEDLAKLDAEFTPDAFTPDAFTPDAFTPDAFTPDAFTPDAFTPDAFTPDAFTPDAFTPDAFTPDAFTPDAYTPDAYTPDAFTPDAFTPDAYTPDAFTPDAFTPDAYTPDAFTPDAFTSAQTRSLIGVSAHEGTAGEGIVKNTWLNGDDFYVRIRGRNGAFSLAAPFSLRVIVVTGQCSGVPAVTGSTPTVAAGTHDTVILTHLERMQTDASASDPAAQAAEKATLEARLSTLAARPDVNGVIVRLGEAQYSKVASAHAAADAHPNCPFAKNRVASAIKEVVDGYRAGHPIKYVVVVGDDSVIPFFRHPDQALLANENGYKPPVKDNTASRAALELSYVLSDDDYGASTTLSIKDHTLPLVDVAVGRLVETAGDATALLDGYLADPDGIAPAPTSALVTGYDFFSDMANAVVGRLSQDGGVATTALIQPAAQPPTDEATNWTADDLRAAWLSTRRDVFFGGMHGSAFSGLASDYETRMRASELASAAIDMRNTVNVFQSCHLGYNRVNLDGVSGLPDEPDWAQAFARQGALLIASTGYQYGETELVEYGERLNLEIADQLRTGTGPIPVGRALVAAKRAYLAGTPLLRALHEKTVLEVALFGLPMLRLDLPGTRDPAPASAATVDPTEIVGTSPGAVLGLATHDLTVLPTLGTVPVTLTNTDTGDAVATSYLTGGDGAVANAAEPIQPREVEDVTAAGTSLRGVGFLGGLYDDATGVRPLTGAPATELRTPHVPFASDVFFPTRFWSVNYFDAVDGGQTRLIVLPSQFRGVDVGTRRSFDEVRLRLFYSASTASYTATPSGAGPTQTNTPALAGAPAIAHVAGIPGPGGTVSFNVDVGGAVYAGIQAVWVTYTGTTGERFGEWRSTFLQQVGGTTRWTGTLGPADLGTTPVGDLRFMVQAVNGVGLVSLETSLGAYYTPAPETVQASNPKDPTSLAFETPPAGGTYRERTSFTAVLQSSLPAGQTLTFKLGAERRQAITDAAGRATVTFSLFQPPGAYEVQASSGETTTHLASSATTSFSIVPRNTTLALALPPAPHPQYSDPTGLVATLADDATPSRRLREQTVFYIVSGPSGTFATADITDYLGRVPLGMLPLDPGSYVVDAYFSGTVPLPGGALTLENDRYNPSSASATLVVSAEAAMPTYTGALLAATGVAFTAQASVAQEDDGSPGDITKAQVRFTVKDGAGTVMQSILADVGADGMATATLTGVLTGVYTIDTEVEGGFFDSGPVQTLFASYDPSAGFVTGGGWIISPAGAYLADPAATGRAHFAFVSKYQRGATVPTGNTQFRFETVGLAFKSTSYEWLVVSGKRAQYKGAGTVNGVAGYQFLLTATDGDAKQADDPDLFRIKIWDATGLIYDNVSGALDDLDNANPQVIAGGNIVIQR